MGKNKCPYCKELTGKSIRKALRLIDLESCNRKLSDLNKTYFVKIISLQIKLKEYTDRKEF